MKEKNCVDCKYKNPCPARDWEEHGYKCKDCIYNELSEEEKKINWPSLLLAGWF